MARNLSLQYPDGTRALREVSLSLQPGEMMVLSGPSGSGKTSLLKLLLGMEEPSSGTLEVLGLSMESKPNLNLLRSLRRRIGPVFQDFRLMPGRTAMDQIIIGMRMLNFTRSEMRQCAMAALEQVGLAGKASSRVENLSFGEAQRVAIARAVARKPELILADEPTGNLDQENAVKILALLHSLKSPETAVLVTTHATHLIKSTSGVRMMHILEGRLTSDQAEE